MMSALLDEAIRRRVYWWRRPDGQPNAGDELARGIVESMLRLRDLVSYSNGIVGHRKLFSIGSVIHFARDRDCIWGSGINGKIGSSMHQFQTLDVRAVRGPRTAEFLRARQISVPDVYGDPGLLAPLFYPWKYTAPEKERVVYVPHMNDLEPVSFGNAVNGVICTPLQGPARFIRTLLSASRVVSRSLHGVVLAEAFGIPAVRVTGSSEPDFKYLDYYEGTGRSGMQFPSSILEAVNAQTPPPPPLVEIQERLCSAFPYDLWASN